MSCSIDFEHTWKLGFQGAESKIYFGLHSNKRCVIKHRFPKTYRHEILDKKLTKERTKRERRMIEKVGSSSSELAPYMPKVLWSNGGTLLMTEITDCDTVYNFIENTCPMPNGLDKLIGKCLADLHNIGVIHGDVTTCNLLLKRKQNAHDSMSPVKKIKPDDIFETHIVIPIDFGLSTGSNHAEERAVDLYVLERALISTHFSDSDFFKNILESYIEFINEDTCEPPGKQKIIDRYRDVKSRGRKSEYAGE